MTTESGAITVAVDLRGELHAVRDQGDRSTCLACATSDAHSFLHNCVPLSAEFLFYHAIQIAKVGNIADGITFEEAAVALAQKGQPSEHEWPYNKTQPDPWTPPVVTRIWRGNVEHSGTDAAVAITQLINNRQPVILGIKISSAFLSPSKPHFTIQADGDGFGGHAVLVVGHGQDTIGQQFLRIQNSWGASWADEGRAWLSTEYVKDKLIGYASVVSHE